MLFLFSPFPPLQKSMPASLRTKPCTPTRIHVTWRLSHLCSRPVGTILHVAHYNHTITPELLPYQQTHGSFRALPLQFHQIKSVHIWSGCHRDQWLPHGLACPWGSIKAEPSPLMQPVAEQRHVSWCAWPCQEPREPKPRRQPWCSFSTTTTQQFPTQIL